MRATARRVDLPAPGTVAFDFDGLRGTASLALRATAA